MVTIREDHKRTDDVIVDDLTRSDSTTIHFVLQLLASSWHARRTVYECCSCLRASLPQHVSFMQRCAACVFTDAFSLSTTPTPASARR
jgi:hypothetical protein